MIWALLAAYFLGGGAGGISGSALTSAGVKQLSENAEMIIEDSGRSEAAQQILRELRKETKSFQKLFGRSGGQLSKSYIDHAADRDETVEILTELNVGWEAAQQRALDLRFELKESMTEEEWSKLFNAE
jgi:hypothetical protein